MYVYYLLTGSATQADVGYSMTSGNLNYEYGAPLSEFPLGVGVAHGQSFSFTAKSVGGGDLTCSIVYRGVVLNTDHGSSVSCSAVVP